MKIIAIASIGGHWVQLLRLMPLFENHNVTFVSTSPKFSSTVSGYNYYSIPDSNRNDKLAVIRCTFAIIRVVLLTKPGLIITTGAAPGIIAIIVGKMLGVRTIWIDSIANVAKLSLSGKMALKFADRVYTQWEHLADEKVMYAGSVL